MKMRKPFLISYGPMRRMNRSDADCALGKIRSGAFTLVELLVVIAIIAILASLLIPALARAKASGYTTVCISNQKQLLLAWHLYAEDTQRYPRNYDYRGAVPTNAANWVAGGMTYETMLHAAIPLSDATNSAILTDPQRTQLATYSPAAGVFRCPADKSYAIRPPPSGPRYPRTRSYSMNNFVGETQILEDPTKVQFVSPENFSGTSPSEITVFLEQHQDSIADAYFVLGTELEINWGWDDVPAAQHTRGAVFSFADAHVQSRKWKDNRTLFPIKRTYLWGIAQPNNPDLAWMYQHATIPK
jgi:prepilin-type N-terminal cleavage/methylation domain-containing protein